MKKAILKTSGTLLVVGLALTAMLFGCKHKAEPKSKAEQQTGKVTITILGDSNVKSIETEIFTVDKGSKWSDIKGDVKVTYKDDYEAAGFKLGFPNGMNLTDNYVFNINITVVAVSKAKGTQQIEKVTITVAGDANVTVNAPASFEVAKGSKWGDIKGNVNVTYKEGYESAGFKLENASGQDLTDDYAFNESKTVFAVSKKQMVTITVAGDANVTVNAPASFEVAKGSKWGDIKGNVNVTYNEGYGAAGFKLENASGQDLTDDYAFNESKTVFAVSKQIVTITVKGDERTDIFSGPFIKVDYDKTWQDIKSQAQGKVGLKVEWRGGDYAIYEWRLDGETGEKLTDDYKVKTDITVYAVTNYAKFNIDNNEISITLVGRGYIGGSPKGKIIIPENITSIGEIAFRDCTGLTSVSFPASLTSIGESAFRACTGLTSVSFPASLTSIGKNAFDGCKGLTSVDLSICTSLTSIGGYAFDGCTGLTSVSFPASLTSIGWSAFEKCSGLTTVSLSGCTSLTSIGESAFIRCSGLTSVSFPASLTSIGWHAFNGCSGLKSVTFPASLTSIGSYAFYECKGLTSVSFPASLTSIGESAFEGCSSLTSVTVDVGNSTYKAVDNVVYTKDGTTLVFAAGGLTSVTIPNTVTSIGNGAFDGCTGITSVSFPASLTKIGRWAFSGCDNLTSATFADAAGWAVCDDNGYENGVSYIQQSDLANPATAAKYLRDTYRKKYWKKN